MKHKLTGLTVILGYLIIGAIAGNLAVAETNVKVFVTKTWVDLPREDFRIKGGYRIPLHVSEPGGVIREAWPVTVGVPLPRGVITSAEQCRLVDEDGRELPLQTRALAHWPDKSVKWLLLDFQLTLKANEKRTLSLSVGQSDPNSLFGFKKLSHTACHPMPIRLTEKDGRTEVDTGVLKFNVLSNRFSFLDGATVRERLVVERGEAFVELRDRQTNAAALRGGEYLASRAKDVKVEWEERGPLRAVVKITCLPEAADGRKAMPLTLRLEMYAGKSFARVYHTFVMSERPVDVSIPRMGLALNLAGRETPGRVCLGSEKPEDLSGSAWILHDNWNHCRIHPAAGALREETGPLRWLDDSGPKGGVTVLVRDMEKNYPKELKADPVSNAVINYIWPADLGQDMDMRVELINPSPGMIEYKAKYPDRFRMAEHGGPTPEEAAKTRGEKGQGTAKTHEFFYYFHAGDARAAKCADMCKAFNDPLVGYVTSQWYPFTEVIGKYHPYDPTNFPALEAYMTRHLNWVIKHQREWSLWYGMWDYGDTQSYYGGEVPGQWWRYVDRFGWLNTEAYVDSAAWMSYLRTGKREYYDFAEALERHHMDVDTHFVSDPPELVKARNGYDTMGGSVRHDINHWGGEINDEQTWNAGEILYYYLSGYQRALDVAKLQGEYGEHSRLAAAWESGYAFRATVNSWRMVGRLWEATGEARYKELADKAAAGYRKYQLANGMWDNVHFSYMGHAVAEWYYISDNQDCRQIILNMKDLWAESGVTESDLDNGASFPAYQYWLTRDPVYLVPGYIMIMGKSILRSQIPVFKTDELGVKDFEGYEGGGKGCRLCRLEGLPYFMAALYASRTDMDRFLPNIDRYCCPWDYSIIPLTNAQFYVVDLSGVANANPFVNTFHFKDELPIPAHITTYLKDNLRPLKPGEIGFQFGLPDYPRVAGYILVPGVAIYPYYENMPCAGQNLYGPPFGAVAAYGGVPFALANPEAGKAVIVLDKGQRVRIPVNQTAQRVHFLGHVHYRSSYPSIDSLRDGLAARYIIHYRGGKEQVIDLRNNHEMENMRSWTYTDKARLAYYGPSELHLNMCSYDLQPEPVESIEFMEMGMDLNPVLLAITLEGQSFPPPPPAVRSFTFKAPATNNPAVQYVAPDMLFTEQAGYGWVNQVARSITNYPGKTALKGENHFRAHVSNGLYEIRLNDGFGNWAGVNVTVKDRPIVQCPQIVGENLVIPAKVEDGQLDLILKYFPGPDWAGPPYLFLGSLEVAPLRPDLGWLYASKDKGAAAPECPRLRFGWDKYLPLHGSVTCAGLNTVDFFDPAMFSVDLPNGDYDCELRMTAYHPGHPTVVDIWAENIPVVSGLPLTYPETVKFTTHIADGRLDLRIQLNKEKVRCRDPNWEVNSLVITPKK